MNLSFVSNVYDCSYRRDYFKDTPKCGVVHEGVFLS